MKIRPVGAELFNAGGGADTTQLTAAFRNFANAPKNPVLNLQRTKGAPNMRSNPFILFRQFVPVYCTTLNTQMHCQGKPQFLLLQQVVRRTQG